MQFWQATGLCEPDYLAAAEIKTADHIPKHA
jgi:hypothetical protein